jgi:hypothetical protein
LPPLPAVKGSRAYIKVRLATAVLENVEEYLDYYSSVRESGNTNLLVVSTARGLKDRYVNVALRARSFRDVAYVTPLFYFLNSAVGQRDLRALLDVARAWQVGMQGINRLGTTVPGVESLADAVLVRFPSWKVGYDVWWARKGNGLTRAYGKAIDKEFWALTREVLAAGVADSLETHDRNVTDDMSEVAELEHAGVNTDEVESGFGNVDYVGFRAQCPTSTVFGPAHAQKMGSFLTWPEAKQRLLTRLGQTRFDGLDMGLEKEKWKLKSYFSIPADERWRLLRDIRRRYQDLCVDKPRAALEAHNDAKRQRSTDAAADAEQREKQKALAYARFKDMEMATSVAGLATTRRGFEGNGKLLGTNDSYIEYLRDQLRAREHAYGQTKTKNALPAIGSGNTGAEVERIEGGLKPLFAVPLPRLKRAPTPLPSRELSQAVAPTELAKKLLKEYAKRMREAWVELGEYMSKGTFRLPRRPVANARNQRARKPRASPAAPAPRTPTARQQAAVMGKDFEDEGVAWRVLDVKWSAEFQEMVVFYYDVEGADEQDLKAIDATDDFEHCELDAVEMSTLKEVLGWIKESAGARQGGDQEGPRKKART